MDSEQPISPVSKNELEPLAQEQTGEATQNSTPENNIIENSIALGVSAAHDANIANSLVLGGIAAGNDLTISDSAGAAFVAGNDLHVQDSGGMVMVVGGETHLKDGVIGILVAGGDIHLDGDSKILMTSQQAMIFGAAAGLVLALFGLLFGRKATK